MPAAPSRALAARAVIAARAASGGAINGPKSATLATRFGWAAAMCWQTMVPIEWPIQCARVTFRRSQTSSMSAT